MSFLIYIVTNSMNGMRYIGQTNIGLVGRRKYHEMAVRNGSKTKFHNALRHYGFENFIWEVLEYCDSRETLNFREVCLILQYGTLAPYGYNLTTGGKFRTQYSEETKRKMSISRTGMKLKPLSERTKKLMSESRMGARNGMYGKKHTELTLRKIREKAQLRGMCGDKNPNAKITYEIATEIRLKFSTQNYSKAQLAREYHLSEGAIYSILNNSRWISKH